MSERVLSSPLRLLSYLRWLAVLGQVVAVVVVTGPMHVALPPAPLWAGIGVQALFNAYATWRARRAAVAVPAEVFAHLLFDILLLTWLVFWSGGIENPFSSLFLLPIALAVLALPPGWVWGVTAASGAGYVVSAFFADGLPHVHGAFGDTFDLHKLGMVVNFLVSLLVIVVFFSRMAAMRRAQEREMERLRERFARNEGIIALATHAASVAHELNTPLGTMTLMVDDLLRDAGSDAQREEFATLKALLGVCSERVRQLAAPADEDGGLRRLVHLDQVIERWQLVRPAIDLQRSGSIAGHEMVDPAIGFLLQALLNNAADAGLQAGTPRVDLALDADASGLRGEIRDYGRGLAGAEPFLPALFRSSKPDGMGIGLALSHATVERLGGELSMRGTDGQGVRVTFRLPAHGAAR